MIKIRNNNRPNINPCGTPALTLVQVDTWILRATFFFPLLKKFFKVFNKSPEMPFCSSLKITPRCQILTKALDMPKKTFPTSRLSSNKLQIPWVIDKRWLMQE